MWLLTWRSTRCTWKRGILNGTREERGHRISREERGEGRVAGCFKLLGARILCSYSCPHRSGQDVPINLQKDKCSLFCNFLSLGEWKIVTPLKIRALRVGYHVYFRLEAAFFYKRCRASMTKHRQQSTRVRAKGIDSIWSQVCSSQTQNIQEWKLGSLLQSSWRDMGWSFLLLFLSKPLAFSNDQLLMIL